MTKDELDTPILLINRKKLERNLAGMVAFAREHGVRLRPHAKTHKMPQIAQRQLECGAAGITVAKLGEAEVMADGGIDDIFIAYQIVGEQKISRLSSLIRRGLRVLSGVDSIEGSRELARRMMQEGLIHEVLIEVDCGLHRCGLADSGNILELARFIADIGSLRLRGIFTHEGHAGNEVERSRIARVGLSVGRRMVDMKEYLENNGIPCPEVSVGSTPAHEFTAAVPGITEMRPGTYVFNDLAMVRMGAAEPEDCALTVLSTVISRPAPDRAVIDAGSKALSSFRYPFSEGMGQIQTDPPLMLTWTNEEHGVIQAEGMELKIGDRVEIVPNHACSTLNMHDQAALVQGDQVVAIWPVAARGKIR